MKNRILVAFMLCSSFIGANEVVRNPLWEEDSHFAQYRVLCIEGSIYHIGELVREARNHPHDMQRFLDCIEAEVNNCKQSL